MKRIKYLLPCLLIIGYCHCSATDITSAKPSKNSSVQTIAFAVTSTAVSKPAQKENGYLPLSFDLLGDYEYRERLAINGKAVTNHADQIPQNVKDMNGKKVAIQGYFYPVQVENGGTIKDFLLLRNQIYCCFGCAVRINEWISVEMRDGKPLKADFTSRPVTIYGTLEVGPKYQDDILIDLYRMKADKLVEDK